MYQQRGLYPSLMNNFYEAHILKSSSIKNDGCFLHFCRNIEKLSVVNFDLKPFEKCNIWKTNLKLLPLDGKLIHMFCLIRTLMDFGRDLFPKKGHLGAGVVSAKKRLSCRNVTQEGIHHSPLKYFTQGLFYIGYTIGQAKKLSRQL